MLKAGIIGLPNVGKSTLFNAILRAHKAPAENYPFCTIEPNIGVVQVPDERLEKLAAVVKAPRIIHAAIEFVDIAGLVKGASKGEGLGNKFLSLIREVDALVHVLRCFEDPDVVHVTGSIDPIRDLEIVNAELILADLESLHRHREKIAKDIKRHDKTALLEDALMQRLEQHLNSGQLACTLKLYPEELAVTRNFFLLTDKPVIYALNVKEQDISAAALNPAVQRVREYVQTHQGCEAVVVAAQLESELVDLSPEEALEYLKELGVTETGLSALIRSTYHLLGLRTFFTFNENEARAWTIHAGATAPKAAGVVHTDFERGFIKAEVIKWNDLVESGSVARARETGHYRTEGKEYEVQDGDVLLFKFHV